MNMNRMKNANNQRKGNKKNGRKRAKVQRPVFKNPIVKRKVNPRSKRQNVQIGMAYEVSRTEVVTEIGFANNTTVVGAVYTINPANTGLFKWLSGLSSLYRMYKFLSITFNYIPTCSVFKNGQLVQYFVEDDDQLPITIDIAKMNQPSKQSPIRTKQSFSVPQYALNRLNQFYIRHLFSTDPIEDTDPRLHDLGIYGFFADGDQGSAGTITVTYRVKLIYPKIQEPNPSSLAQPGIINTYAQQREANQTDPPLQDNNIDVVLDQETSVNEDVSLQVLDPNELSNFFDVGLLNILSFGASGTNRLKVSFKDEFDGRIDLNLPIRISHTSAPTSWHILSDVVSQVLYSSDLFPSVNLISDLRLSPVANVSQKGNTATQQTYQLNCSFTGIYKKDSFVEIFLRTGFALISAYTFAPYYSYNPDQQPLTPGSITKKRSVLSLNLLPIAVDYIQNLIAEAIK